MNDEARARDCLREYNILGAEILVQRIAAAFAAVREECAQVAERQGTPGEPIRKATAQQIAQAIRSGPSRPGEGGG